MVDLTGLTNNPPYVNPANASVVTAGGTTSLCTSATIPMVNQVSNFISITAPQINNSAHNNIGPADGYVLYTAPGGSTFYVTTIIFASNSLGDGTTPFIYNVGTNNQVTALLQAGQTLPLNCGGFPVAIIPGGQSIILTTNGKNDSPSSGPRGGAGNPTFIGYLIFGTTN